MNVDRRSKPSDHNADAVYRNLTAALMVSILAILGGCSPTASPPLSALPQPGIPEAPQPGSITWQLSRPWRHVGAPRSEEQFTRDKYSCATTARLAPTNGADPDIVFDVTFLECLRSKGYEPEPANAPQRDSLENALSAFGRDDYSAAMRLSRPLAMQGNPTAELMVGFMYAFGDGVVRDYAEAVKWLRLAADQGNARAQFAMAAMYLNGNGVPKDFAEACMWLNLAAVGGIKEADQLRHDLERSMTPEQISEAERLTIEWKSIHSGE